MNQIDILKNFLHNKVIFDSEFNNVINTNNSKAAAQTIDFTDQKTSTFSTEQGNYIEGFLIGTKPTKHLNEAARFAISKNTALENVKKFVGKTFAIIPEKLQKGNIDAHFYGPDKKSTIEGYQKYGHGIIQKIKGPFSYNDGTDDIYFTHVTKLNDSKSASILTELGSKTILPFATSPHIWKDDDSNDLEMIEWDPLGIALVGHGAYGEISVINKFCSGSQTSCHKSFGASLGSISPPELDEKTSILISSYFQKTASLEAPAGSDSQSQNNNNKINQIQLVRSFLNGNF